MVLKFPGKAHPLDCDGVTLFTPEEVSILRTLLQDHINTLSDIACHYAPADVTPYLGQLEELEKKLREMEKE